VVVVAVVAALSRQRRQSADSFFASDQIKPMRHLYLRLSVLD